MVFKGGTLLRVCYRHDWRFSEDLDFDWIHTDDSKQAIHDFFDRVLKAASRAYGTAFDTKWGANKLNIYWEQPGAVTGVIYTDVKPHHHLGAERIGGLCGVVSVPPVDEFGGDQYGDGEAQGGVAAVGSAVGVAAELPVVRQPGVGGLDDPALAQGFGSGPAPGVAGRAFGCAHDVVDAPASAGLGHGVAGVAAVEVDGLYVCDQAGAGDGGQCGLQHCLVVDVGRVGGPADGDAVAVCGDGPLPPEAATLSAQDSTTSTRASPTPPPRTSGATHIERSSTSSFRSV